MRNIETEKVVRNSKNKYLQTKNSKFKENNIQSVSSNTLKGKTISLKVEYLNINGEGVSTYQNKKVCVEGVLPNEEVLCKVETEKQNFLGCKLLKILKSNPNRILPKCIYSGKCGGCNFDYVDYKTSIEIKKQALKDCFSSLYDGQVDIVKSDNEFNYRNKISLCANKCLLGLKAKRTNEVIKIDKCLITSNKINEILPQISQFIKDLNSFSLKHVVIREIDKSLIITYVFDKVDGKKTQLVKEFSENLNQNQNFEVGVYININKSNHEILGKDWLHIFGIKTQTSVLNDIEFEVHPYSFLQVNNNIRDKIYNYIFENIRNEVVIEGYSGAGIMSCMLAKKAKQVFSVEINTQSYLNAEKTKHKNKVTNLININDSCQNVLPNLVQEYPNSIFLIDPPRSGCDQKTLQALKESEIKKIIYISCNPYTLKQNIGFLKDSYKIDSLKMFDMFPQTFHMETVAILSKK